MTCRNGTACVFKVHVKSNTRMCDFCQVSRANRGHSLCGSCYTQWSTRTSLPHWNEDGDATPARGARCIVYHGTSLSSARTIVRTRHFNASTGAEQLCGDGVYFASAARASTFARTAPERNLGAGSALVVCAVDCTNVHVANAEDPTGAWRAGGVPMYYAQQVSGRPLHRPELCVADVSRIQVLGYMRPR